MRPFGKPPCLCSARPTRCKRLAIDRVAPSWQTRSTEPISMPNSREAVATRAFSSPRFNRSSASSRSFRSEEHTSELQSLTNLVCRLLLDCFAHRPALHPFPTRRSSDLTTVFVLSASDALQKAGDRSRGTELANQIDGTDIDA